MRSLIFGSVAVIGVCFLWLPGCAVGRREHDGAIVLGFEAGKLPETANQLVATAAGFIPGPWGEVVKYAVGALGVGGLVHARNRSHAKRESDAAYDEGRAAGLAEAERAKRAYDEARLREAYKRLPPPPDVVPNGGAV